MAFIVAATALGLEALLALLLGIGLVIVPIELGYLLIRAKLTTGTWSLAGMLPYRETLRPRQYALWGVGLAAWFIVLLAISTVFLDRWIADT
jgi:hypothetical protein